MPFKIIRDNITNVDVDAVVNAANNQLKKGGGVCGSIFSGAGEAALSEACDKIGYCATGDAVITKGFNLKAKYIIHTVGPKYGENPDKQASQLYSCYEKSLHLALKRGAYSIAFPLISSGIYGYPKDEALKIAGDAIRDFLKENEMEIYLVVYDKGAYMASRELFEDVKSYILEREVREDKSRRYSEEEVVMFTCAEAAGEHKARPLKMAKTLETLLERQGETFSQMMLRLIDEKGMSDVEVYKRANIDRKHFSKMRKKDYCPKKVTAIAIIIALRLNMKEARELLSRAGYAFSVSSKFDIIIEYFIENRKYDVYEINETLFDFDQPLLGV